MFDPIERRNARGDAIESLRIQDWPTGASRLVAQDGGGVASVELDDAVLDELFIQIDILRTNRREARRAQNERFEAAAASGYGAHSTTPVRRSADGDRLIDRVR